MVERINRQTDERIYQPKIHSSLIHELYKIGERTCLPMTVIVDLAIREYLAKYQADLDPDGQVNEQNV
jgi:hypothetical protein